MNAGDTGKAGTAHVVIVGGGFAGLKCAIDLAAHSEIAITLIDRNNYQQFQPLLYQVAAGILSSDNAAFALRDVLRNRQNVDVRMDEVVAVDLAKRTVRTAEGVLISGDYLALATGSRVNFYGIPGADPHTFPLYSLTDAERLRSAILHAFEDADRNRESAAEGLLNFVVVGGGPTGVEMAGTLSDILKHVLLKEFRHVAGLRPQVYLIEAASEVLTAFSPESRRYAASALKDHDVSVLTGIAVKEITPEAVLLADGSSIATKTVIWAAGLKAVAIPTEPGVPKIPTGRFAVEKDLTLPGFDRVYALGDLANALDQNAKPLPQLAAVAQQAGKSCAGNIIASIKGEPSKPFVYSDRGILAMIGRNSAIAELGKSHHEIVGPVAFITWLGVHTALLTDVRAKVEAIVEWAWAYFGSEHAGQLIDR